jgi:ATP-dependent DNA helicase RecG
MSFFDTPLADVPGIGPRRADALGKVGLRTAHDLIRQYPRRYLDRSTINRIADLREDMAEATVVGTIKTSNLVPGRGRARFELLIEDADGGRMKAVWFQGAQWIGRMFKRGERVAFHGKVQKFGSSFSFTHPDFDKLDSEAAALDTGRIIPLYPGGAALDKVGLTSRAFRKLIYRLFKEHGLELPPDPFTERMRDHYGLIDGRVALRAIHFPKSDEELQAARQRLKFEELFYLQLLLALTRQVRDDQPGVVLGQPGELTRRFLEDVLPFRLTGAQRAALDDIIGDTQSGRQMNRLVQGDVGSGKTVVAVAAILQAVDNGYQGSFMAPTEILAEQHYANLQKYLEPLGLKVHLLVGGQRKKLREEILAELADGTAHVCVGTHALIEDNVQFHRLGITVVDEQHRFGVMQRARLFGKGERPHMLLMTATPIPRSLAMTLYGDLDVSLMKEMPAGRKPIETWVRMEKRRGEVYAFVKEQLREGGQAYVVYPLVEESEKLELKDAETGHQELTELFRPYRVELVHGRMLAYEKEEAMQRFKDREADILVATTVIEVGVDVPNASIMVIEHAERFGLSQLHQLRGRVGRGDRQSYCVLMTDYKRSAEAVERLEAMAKTTDGFEISEIDLQIRGAGDIFGTRQSGMPALKIANLTTDVELLQQAREAAFALVRADPDLSHPDHAGIRSAYQASYRGKGLGLLRVG